MPGPIDYRSMIGGLMGNVTPVNSDPNDMANIIAEIKKQQLQNGMLRPSPSGQPVMPMSPAPAPPGYRLNDLPGLMRLAAMGDDQRKKGINPLNQTEGAYKPTGGAGGKRVAPKPTPPKKKPKAKSTDFMSSLSAFKKAYDDGLLD